MESRIGPIRPNDYGVPGEKLVNYFLGGDQYECKIINDLRRVVVMDGWYSYRYVADVDPEDLGGKNKRKIVKETLDGVDWENLDKYPDSTLGVNLDSVIEDKSGNAEIVTYHYKLWRMAMAGLKFEWHGPTGNGVVLKGIKDDEQGVSVPSSLEDDDGNVLATFDYELIRRRGFVLVDWWVTKGTFGKPSAHVVITHRSTLGTQ